MGRPRKQDTKVTKASALKTAPKTQKKQTAKAKPKTSSESPVGRYAVDCQEIEEQWPDQAEDLGLDIYGTNEPGIYQASFDFGILEGVMMLGVDKANVEEYCSRIEGNDDTEEYDDDDDDDDDEEEQYQTGSKRKASSSKPASEPAPKRGRGRPPKNDSAGKDQGLLYYLKMKCRETEGQIHPSPESGSIKFKDAKLSSFKGEVGLPAVGSNTTFTAKKFSGKPTGLKIEWADLSEDRYEEESVARWH